MERRDYRSRAALVQRLIELLLSRDEGIELAQLPAEVPNAVASRILKPLAVRGLVKIEGAHWVASPVLVAGTRLPLEGE